MSRKREQLAAQQASLRSTRKIIWWVFASSWLTMSLLLIMPIYRIAKNQFIVAKQSKSWPTTIGTVRWDTKTHTSTSGQRGSTIQLICSYQYTVEGTSYVGRNFALDTESINLDDDDFSSFDDVAFLSEFYNSNGSSHGHREALREAKLRHIAGKYESDKGKVTVHYNPQQPDQAVLITGRSASSVGMLALMFAFVLGGGLWVLVSGTMVFLKKQPLTAA